jgi:hypothetical protein
MQSFNETLASAPIFLTGRAWNALKSLPKPVELSLGLEFPVQCIGLDDAPVRVNDDDLASAPESASGRFSELDSKAIGTGRQSCGLP